MDLIGIENEAEFFPSGTLSDVLKEELSDITARWAGLEKSAHPIERLSRVATSTIEALRQIRNSSDADRRTELTREMHHALLGALGYAWKREAAFTALADAPIIPLISRVADASGRDALWIIEAPLPDAEDEAADPLGACFAPDQFPADAGEAALLDRTIESVLAEGVFELADGPRHVMVLGLSQIVLIDKRKWPARSVLRFDLQEIFTRTDRDTLTVMACLISRETRVPEQGAPISDRLEEEAQRNANAVTTSLKRTVRDAIELLGQEVLTVTGGKNKDVWIDGPELSRECLRYMYRLLFLFYAEANPRLNLLDLKNPIYATGYSLETLRDLESVPLRTTADREGTFLWESLQQTLTLLYTGLDLADEEKGSGLRLPSVKVSLLDPASTPLLNGLMLRNEAIQKVIRLLSLRSTGKSTGRISYAKLGIGQLGAVYETLISFTGVVAKTDLIELKPRKGRSNDAAEAENGDDADAPDLDDDVEEDLFGDEEAEQDEAFRRDKVDPLAPSWFVPRSRIGEFAPEEIVFNGSEALVYPKGTFIYRLAGRDREKSASYYTPEPLARLLVKHALMERCRDLTADELLDLKILEPAMGSAAFLVETTNQLADLYLERKQKETGTTIPQDRVVVEKQKVRAYIADRNCFGVDLNPIAVELGAISLWLNSLHASDFSPWFGDQLHSGNSLIGARRASYAPTWLSARTQADLWLNAKPDEIGWRKRLPENHVWQWLLPAKDMANFDKDKSIKPFAGDAQDQIKAWRKDGFFKKLEPHEIKLVQKLSRVAEALFDQVADDLAKTRAAANDAITLWPDKVIPGNKGLDFHAKAKLNAHLIGADHATNTLPYKRLKTAMDAWCALWLWPLDKADLLPSRAEFLQGMAMILEGGFTPDGSLAAPSMDEFADPAPDFLDMMEPDAPARDLFKAAAKRQDGLFRETNVEALIETFDWLGVAVEVAERERFVHFDLIFADIMKARGGFDLIVGNPPWAQPAWDISDALASIEPAVAIRRLTAAQASSESHAILNSDKKIDRFLGEYVTERARGAASGSQFFFPYSSAGANNLYKSFVDISFRLASDGGTVALIHQDGHWNDPKAGLFRSQCFHRLRKRFHFRNQIKTKNFSEVDNNRTFSLNIYAGYQSEISFLCLSNAFLASQVEESLLHDGIGEVPQLKREDGSWDTRGHRDRLVKFDHGLLTVINNFLEDGATPLDQTKLIHLHSKNVELTLKAIGGIPSLYSVEKNWQMRGIWVEGSSGSGSRQIRKAAQAPEKIEEAVYSGSNFFISNPFYKSARLPCRSNKDYSVVDTKAVKDGFIPVTNYVARALDSEYFSELPVCVWDHSVHHTDFFRVAIRKMVALGGERSLVACILPRGLSHTDSVMSVCFSNEEAMLNSAALWSSIPFDYLIRIIARQNLHEGDVGALPFPILPDAAIQRVLLLNCLTREYSELWDRVYNRLGETGWSCTDVRLSKSMICGKSMVWNESCPIRTDYARRMAQVEIDVLVAQAAGFSLEQLAEAYRVQFPVMRQYEAATWYDQEGKIVWTSSRGLPGVGWLDERGKSPGRAAWDKILAENPSELTCTAIDDTMPGGPREVTRHFVGPFTQCDRIEDYKRAWAHFERLKSEEAA
ncbi:MULTISPECIES: N-6 DNA methylase [unclassified Phaeobacter]|uniref:N-6 DNA methylase n=1 Tax=unclassified Phaeobacter TaxID=2621772 RepID=UPI003A840516